MLDILKGGTASPKLVGAARGVLEAVAMAMLGAVAYYVNGDSLPAQWAPLVPIILFGIRAFEGYIDHRLDPSVNRAPLAADAADPAPAPAPAEPQTVLTTPPDAPRP